MFRKTAEPMSGGRGGGLKFEKKNAKKTKKNKQAYTLEKMGYRFSCNLYFFIHRQPNNIGHAWQQPKALFLISLSLVGEGRGHSCYILALRLLDYMGFAMEAKPEWKMGVGHTLQPQSLGTGDRCPPPTNPKFTSFVWDWEGAQK